MSKEKGKNKKGKQAVIGTGDTSGSKALFATEDRSKTSTNAKTLNLGRGSFAGLRKNIEDTERDVAHLISEVSEQKKEITKVRDKFIEIIAVFVALFTFISVDVQIFKENNISHFVALGFVLIMFASLYFFVKLLVSINNSTDFGYLNSLFVILLIGGGIFLIYIDWSFFDKEYYSKDEIQKMFDVNSAMIQEKNNKNFECSKFQSYWQFRDCLQK